MVNIAAIATHYAGRKYRSRTEARWACFLDACDIRFQYEFEGHGLRSGAYLPDFWLPTFQMYLEIKGGEPNEIERLKCDELAKASGCVVLLAIGQPEERFQVRWFDGDSGDDALYAIARDRRADAGYWLVGDNDTQRWMGGGDITGQCPRYGPMFSGALEQAYATALSAEFERGHGRRRVAPIPELDPARFAEILEPVA